MNLARAGNIPSSSISWDLLRGCCIYKRTLRIWTPRPTCGRILAYAKQQVVGLREHLGLSLCIFKIGVTANLPLRFQDYFNKNYSQMWDPGGTRSGIRRLEYCRDHTRTSATAISYSAATSVWQVMHCIRLKTLDQQQIGKTQSIPLRLGTKNPHFHHCRLKLLAGIQGLQLGFSEGILSTCFD